MIVIVVAVPFYRRGNGGTEVLNHLLYYFRLVSREIIFKSNMSDKQHHGQRSWKLGWNYFPHQLPALPVVHHQPQEKSQSPGEGWDFPYQGTPISGVPPSKSVSRGKVRGTLGPPYPRASHPCSDRFGIAAQLQSSTCRGGLLPSARPPGSWLCRGGGTGTPLGRTWPLWASVPGQSHGRAMLWARPAPFSSLSFYQNHGCWKHFSWIWKRPNYVTVNLREHRKLGSSWSGWLGTPITAIFIYFPL